MEITLLSGLSTQAQAFVKNKVDEGSFINHHKSLSFS